MVRGRIDSTQGSTLTLMAIHSPLGSVDGVPVGIVHLAAEYDSLARTGGLAEAVSGLASYQAAQGIPVTVIIPLHRSVRSAAPQLERVGQPFIISVGSRQEEGRLYRLPVEAGKPKVYCIEHEYFDRAGLYGEAGSDYGDNPQRFAFFCMAALELLPRRAHSPGARCRSSRRCRARRSRAAARTARLCSRAGRARRG